MTPREYADEIVECLEPTVWRDEQEMVEYSTDIRDRIEAAIIAAVKEAREEDHAEHEARLKEGIDVD